MADRFKHVAITGASSGIGAALAEAHAAPGIRLALSGRDMQRLEAVASTCRSLGAEVTTASVDVTEATAVADWIQRVDDLCPLDLVYANAGIGGQQALAGRRGEDIESAQRIVATNLSGVINTVTPASARFQARGRGHLAVIGSLAGRLGLPHSPVYSASKAAVAIYADGMRRLLKPSGIEVTLIEPGFVKTPMSDGVPGSNFMKWPAPKAARAIRSAVEARRTVLRFPWALALILQFARHLPVWLLDRILTAAHQKATRE